MICTCHHHHCAHHRKQQQEGRREKSSLMLQLLRRAGLHLWDSQIYENTTKSATRELLDAHRATWDGINASVGRAANGLEHLWPGGQLLEECIFSRVQEGSSQQNMRPTKGLHLEVFAVAAE